MSRPISILICALGGEGGGVLASWLTSAAIDASFPVQRTSIPGVAQRTGATTYYLEIFPVPRQELKGQEPIMGLHPAEGNLDMIVATELLEVTRALHRGYASKERTLLITSSHRVFTIGEKSRPTPGHFDEQKALEAATTLTRDSITFDGQATARAVGSHLNAVLLGAIAGCGLLPIAEESFRAALRLENKSVEENARGFEAGLAAARARNVRQGRLTSTTAEQHGDSAWVMEAYSSFPAAVRPIVREGILRLIDYQSEHYAQQYLHRLQPLLSLDMRPYRMLDSAARHLALWMSYEDVIRVAQLKTRSTRIERIRAAHGVSAAQPVTIIDFLKPGPAEFCGLMPTWIAKRLLGVIERRGLKNKLSWPLKIPTTSIWGFSLMRTLALLRVWRPFSYGFLEEQRSIDAWLNRVTAAARTNPGFAAEVADCAGLIRGYADTRERAYARLRRIFEVVIDPMLALQMGRDAAEAVKRARLAALADDTGAALETELGRFGNGKVPMGRQHSAAL